MAENRQGSLPTDPTFDHIMNEHSNDHFKLFQKYGKEIITTYRIIDEIIKILERENIYVWPRFMGHGEDNKQCNKLFEIMLVMGESLKLEPIQVFNGTTLVMKDESELMETDEYTCMFEDNYRYLSQFLVKSNNQEESTTDNQTVKNDEGRYLSASALAKNFMEKIEVLQNFADNDSSLKEYFSSELKDLLQKLATNLKNYHNSNILNDATPNQQRYSTKEDDNMVDSINIFKIWHGSSHFITEIENFATKYVIPHDRLKEARQNTQSIIGDIVKQLKKNKIFVTSEFFGQDLDLNFTFRVNYDIKLDIMLVWDVGEIIEIDSAQNFFSFPCKPLNAVARNLITTFETYTNCSYCKVNRNHCCFN
ncbi:hypothetical protein HELRODRAFT_182951 [Helobdella robusta]|uniref:Uncharacterized protein n=1 Tax=Helobdella robusta TaxID=6412 RepID=T1FIZ1_HELRO|nr:hypothetical protein HELRODRAFT_182951 [Helobdella robusta]ESN89941.1 hypothetical protein HELRODRAFT_182951 [Helobdella robusta]